MMTKNIDDDAAGRARTAVNRSTTKTAVIVLHINTRAKHADRNPRRRSRTRRHHRSRAPVLQLGKSANPKIRKQSANKASRPPKPDRELRQMTLRRGGSEQRLRQQRLVQTSGRALHSRSNNLPRQLLLSPVGRLSLFCQRLANRGFPTREDTCRRVLPSGFQACPGPGPSKTPWV